MVGLVEVIVDFLGVCRLDASRVLAGISFQMFDRFIWVVLAVEYG
jgi:hypothetical protein